MNNSPNWTKEEEQNLKSLTTSAHSVKNWEEISQKMKKRGFLKTSSQCKKKFDLIKNPNILKKEWNKEQNKKLFDLHSKFGNAWKDIASYFNQRTDNGIKNQFFSLIRKSLRNARKILGLMSNTECINKMKPRVLTDFIKRKIVVNYPEKMFKSCGKKSEIVSVLNFIQKYSYGQFFEIFSDTTEADLFIIEKVIEFLDDLNCSYNTERNKKIEKKNKKKLDLLKISRNRLFHNKKKNFEILDSNNQKEVSNLPDEYVVLKNKSDNMNQFCNNFFNQKSKMSKNEMNSVFYQLSELSFKMGDLLTISNKKDFEKIMKEEKKKYMEINLTNIKNLENKSNLNLNKISNENNRDSFIQIESDISVDKMSIKSCNKKNSYVINKRTSFDIEKNFEKNYCNPMNFKKTSFELGNKFFKNINRKKSENLHTQNFQDNFQIKNSKEKEYLKAKESFKNLRRRNSEKNENSETKIDVNRLTSFIKNKFKEKSEIKNQGEKNLPLSKSNFVIGIDNILDQSPLAPAKHNYPGIIISKPKFTNGTKDILKKFK